MKLQDRDIINSTSRLNKPPFLIVHINPDKTSDIINIVIDHHMLRHNSIKIIYNFKFKQQKSQSFRPDIINTHFLKDINKFNN